MEKYKHKNDKNKAWRKKKTKVPKLGISAYTKQYILSFSIGRTTKFMDLVFLRQTLFFDIFSCTFPPFMYYLLYSLCVIMHLIVLECVFVA